MRARMFFPMIVLILSSAQAKVLPIGSGEYSGLEAAAADALPGDTILFRSGTHAGGAYVANLKGRSPDAWITITGEPGALIYGGGNAFQLSDPEFVRITHLTFDGQTGNGVNIDDGGSYETPARSINIEDCEWLGINATGNNDMLKLSGVDDFSVRRCRFINGSPGGSMVDMVGCHGGEFQNNRFENAGSNCIQAKGGTANIGIQRNLFYNGGQRAINIGGSTGLPYFRPIDASYEASDIFVFSNIFTGSEAPIAFVGAVNSYVVNNTIYLPEKWVVRILQESTDVRFKKCGFNVFINNLIVLDNRSAAPTFNIGSNTAPETFQFRNNLWYNIDNGSWAGPNVPAPDLESIVGSDPLLRAPAIINGDFFLQQGSPAIGAGTPMSLPALDFLGRQFNVPPSIGAIEGNPNTSAVQMAPSANAFDVSIYPNPASHEAQVRVSGVSGPRVTFRLCDSAGRELGFWVRDAVAAGASMTLPLGQFPGGQYFVVVTGQTVTGNAETDVALQRRVLPLLLQ
ncbi:MAG: right-handed parallel beta-helix repeat-containing protein [Bacteroidota bacterium]